MEGLIEWVYRGVIGVLDYASYFQEHAILAPWNCEVDVINIVELNAIFGEEKEYLSADSVNSASEDSFIYATKYLNSLELGGGYPPYPRYKKMEYSYEAC